MEYSNFDIRIEAIREGIYTVKAESDTQGDTSDTVDTEWIQTNLYEGLRRIEARETDMRFLTEFGAQLLAILLPPNVNDLYQRAVGEARSRFNAGVRIRLLIDDAMLGEIPWEIGYSKLDQNYIAAQPSTPLVRYLSVPTYKRSLFTTNPIRILVVSPRSSGLTNAVEEEQSIHRAVSNLNDRVELVFAHKQNADGRVTCKLLESLLLSQEFNILHFIGHGAYRNEVGSLQLDDETVDDRALGNLVSQTATLSLVVLNSCEGAMGSTENMFTGTAAALVKGGVPAVVAMRYEIFDEAAMLFSRCFYEALFIGKASGHVDYALSAARRALVQEYGGEREIATPVLFTHTSACILFLNRDANPIQSHVIQTFAAAQQQQEELPEPENPHIAALLDAESRLIDRKLLIGAVAVKGGVIAACLVLVLSWISFLDILGLETWSEFVTTSLGDQLVDHEIDPRLQVIALPDLSIADKRQSTSSVLEKLLPTMPRTVAIDAYYSVADDGGFAKSLDEGEALASTISKLVEHGINVVISPDPINNKIPSSMQTAGVLSGHNCTQGSLGINRAVPLFTKLESVETQHAFSAVAVQAHRGGNVRLEPSVYDKRRPYRINCSLLSTDFSSEKTVIGTRFLRFTPLMQLENSLVDYKSDIEFSPEQFRDKLVLIGFRDKVDNVNILEDIRGGFLWQADAINNLLSDSPILRVSNSIQFIIMLIVAVLAGYARLVWSASKASVVLISIGVSGLVLLSCAFLYSGLNWVLNPSYIILSLIIGWVLCGKFKKRYSLT